MPMISGKPKNSSQRLALAKKVKDFISEKKVVPPLSLEEISSLTRSFMRSKKIPADLERFCSVLLNNEVWSKTVSSIPFERRVLMIPQCLRNLSACKAECDEFGLLCAKCGNCQIGTIQTEAEKLGYVVVIAEGTTLVTKLIEGGKIDCVVGVGCMSSLEKVFAKMSGHAVPGIAIPLEYDGCIETKLDLPWLFSAISEKSQEKWRSLPDLDSLKEKVHSLFSKEQIAKLAKSGDSVVDKLVLEYLSGSGKRWRPFLAAGIYFSVRSDAGQMPPPLQSIAMAVECFHKASLIHDDIEDDDDLRDGETTLHKKLGVPIALNVGDSLIGLGYSLIANAGELSSDLKIKMFEAATKAHKDLCEGQGDELFLRNSKKMPSPEKIIEIFKKKTSPAFEVALVLGALCASCEDSVCKLLAEFSESLGVAYQIKDDIEDFQSKKLTRDQALNSLIVALAFQNDSRASKAIFLENCGKCLSDKSLHKIIAAADKSLALDKAKQLCEHFKNEALRSLTSLQNSHIKSFLRKVMSKILS